MKHWFLVKKHRKKFRIEWVTWPRSLWAWVEWAKGWGGEYEEVIPTRQERRRGVEVALITGSDHERRPGLYWSDGTLYREFDDMRKLVLRGLAGFPARLTDGLMRECPDTQIFRVQADGVFTMSIREWGLCLYSENLSDLNDLGVSAQSQVVQGRLL